LQDRTEVSPSQTLVKTWELQNSGTVAWPAGTKLVYARGDLPSIENSFDVAGPIEPGKTVQVSVVVRTPAVPGRYRAFFKLEDNQNNRFGPRLWCDVTVVASVPADKPETSEAAVLDAAQYLFRAEAKEAAEVKARAAAAFWEREHAREEKEKEERLRKEATECVVVHAPKEEEAPKLATTPPGEGTPQHRYREQLASLKSMGWANEELNVSLLDQHQGNVQAVCSWLLEQQGQS
jgi:next-to-BRCA1 protein 1